MESCLEVDISGVIRSCKSPSGGCPGGALAPEGDIKPLIGSWPRNSRHDAAAPFRFRVRR